MYGYDPNQIAAMTPGQQIMMLASDTDDPTAETLHFASQQDYRDWLKKKNA